MWLETVSEAWASPYIILPIGCSIGVDPRSLGLYNTDTMRAADVTGGSEHVTNTQTHIGHVTLKTRPLGTE